MRPVMLLLAGITGMLGLASSAQARIDPAASSLEERRAKLDDRVAEASARLHRDRADSTRGERVAQWPNWPNYWANWPNWRNYR
jgi:hypothetical protein